MLSLSIALLTRNRPASLERCVASVRSQSVQPDEIVISDDSEGSDRAAVQAIAQRWDCRYIPGPQRGLYANRNHTALACTSTHIRTMDDDHCLPPGHLEQCWQAIHRDPAAIWTTGERGYVDGEFYCHSDRANQLCPSGVGMRITNPDDNWGIADGSTIYPRTVFDRGLRMVDDFNSYGESFLEFGAYLYRHGFKSRCIPAAYVEHYADRLTITRRSRGIYISRLYASIAFNRYFCPDRRRLLRYCLTYSRHLAPHFADLPRTWNRVRDRWQSLPPIHPPPQC
jgi:glycosyltransferase involved in cell wall biosynthesis